MPASDLPTHTTWRAGVFLLYRTYLLNKQQMLSINLTRWSTMQYHMVVDHIVFYVIHSQVWYKDGNSHVAGAESCMASVWGELSRGLEDVIIVWEMLKWMCVIMVRLYALPVTYFLKYAWIFCWAIQYLTQIPSSQSVVTNCWGNFKAEYSVTNVWTVN